MVELNEEICSYIQREVHVQLIVGLHIQRELHVESNNGAILGARYSRYSIESGSIHHSD